jgi:hypothetical protein
MHRSHTHAAGSTSLTCCRAQQKEKQKAKGSKGCTDVPCGGEDFSGRCAVSSRAPSLVSVRRSLGGDERILSWDRTRTSYSACLLV